MIRNNGVIGDFLDYTESNGRPETRKTVVS